MAFDIDKMKADGVSAHLIELASMTQETFLLLIARRLEHDKLFQQFLGANVGSIEGMYPYAVAAGLMSEEDRKWLIDEENPYKSQGGEVWFTGTLGECDNGYADAYLIKTDKADMDDLIINYNNYSVSMNGVNLLPKKVEEILMFIDNITDEDATMAFIVETRANWRASVKCPTDITDIEITVSHK